MKLVIGDKGRSSWSLRPWILMKQCGIPFEEIILRLGRPETRSEILRYSPSGRVPVLLDGDLKIWDSLAIAEYLNEKFPERGLLPEEEKERAWARSLCAEMHSGFLDLRREMPFQISRSPDGMSPVGDEVQKDILRVQLLLKEALEYSGGPFMFGEFSMADAFYIPVVLGRFVPYGVPMVGTLADYSRQILNLPSLKAWIEGA
jgi:glutathione S-transferase